MKYLTLLCVFISACSMQNHENLGDIAVQQFSCLHESECNTRMKMDCEKNVHLLRVEPSMTVWYSCK